MHRVMPALPIAGVLLILMTMSLRADVGFVPGDLNNDGSFDVLDSVTVQRALAGLAPGITQSCGHVQALHLPKQAFGQLDCDFPGAVPVMLVDSVGSGRLLRIALDAQVFPSSNTVEQCLDSGTNFEVYRVDIVIDGSSESYFPTDMWCRSADNGFFVGCELPLPLGGVAYTQSLQVTLDNVCCGLGRNMDAEVTYIVE